MPRATAGGAVGRSAERRGAEVAAVVLAAGAGTRLRPLTQLLPKPLCPVLDRTLLDRAVDRVDQVDPDRSIEVVVNAHHGASAVFAHLVGRGMLVGEITARGDVAPLGDGRRVVDLAAEVPSTVVGEATRVPRAGRPTEGGEPSLPGHGAHREVLVSLEFERALGTAGALGRLAPWLDGRGALVLNGDTLTDLDLGRLLDGWDGVRHRVLVVGDAVLDPGARVAGALVPWDVCRSLAAEPSGLWERCWRDASAEGSLEVVGGRGTFVDCGTPGAYLRANLIVLDALTTRDPSTGRGPGRGPDGCWLGPGARVTGTARRSVVGAGAVVAGDVVDSVLWPGARVEAGERLVGAVRTWPAPRAGRALTVLAR